MSANPLKVATDWDTRRRLESCKEGDIEGCIDLVRNAIRSNGHSLTKELVETLP